jgi:hypothetical protein
MKHKAISAICATTLLLMISCWSNPAKAQEIEKVKSATEVRWFGIDFTKAKLVGTPIDFSDLTAVVNKHFASWNNLFISEPKKYDLAGTLGKTVINDIKTALELNAKVDSNTLLVTTANELSMDDLQKVVNNYKSSENGIGMLMVVENFDKPMQSVRLAVVFFDCATQKILFTQKYDKKVGGGIGFRNYWASGFYVVIKQMRIDYPKWGK